MKRFNVRSATAVLAIFAAATSSALAQSWPSKPIKVVTIAPGGGLDITIRTLGPVMSQGLGQPIIIDNRPSTSRIEQVVLQAPADGYTLLYWANGFWLNPFLSSNAKYDPIKEFAPITLTHSSPNVLLVANSLPVKSVRELVAMAQARPGELNVGRTGNPGGSNALAAVMFTSVTKTNMTEIQYKDTNQIINDIAAGRLHVGFPGLSGALPLMKAGKVRALAVTSNETSPQAPDLPTVISIYPDYDASSVQALFAKAGTPAAIVTRLYQETAKAVNHPEVKEKLNPLGIDPVASTPQQLTAFVISDMKKMGKVIQDRGLKTN